MPIIADVTASSGPTLDDLVTEITSAARGFSIAPDKWVTLAGDLTEDGLQFTILEDDLPDGIVVIPYARKATS